MATINKATTAEKRAAQLLRRGVIETPTGLRCRRCDRHVNTKPPRRCPGCNRHPNNCRCPRLERISR